VPPRQPPTEPGFLLLGMALAVPALVCGMLAAMEWPGPGPLARLVLATVAVLSMVAIEGLWWVRAWVGRAVDAWAVACVATVLVADLAFAEGAMLPALSLTVLFVAMPCAAVSRYVRGRARKLGLAPGVAP
jgi:hypothetical protein